MSIKLIPVHRSVAGSPLASPIYSSITSPSTYFPPLVSDVRWKSLTSAGSEMDKDHNDTNSLFGGASVTGLSMPEKLQVPLLSLRLDECSLRGAALDVLGELFSHTNERWRMLM